MGRSYVATDVAIGGNGNLERWISSHQQNVREKLEYYYCGERRSVPLGDIGSESWFIFFSVARAKATR